MKNKEPFILPKENIVPEEILAEEVSEQINTKPSIKKIKTYLNLYLMIFITIKNHPR